MFSAGWFDLGNDLGITSVIAEVVSAASKDGAEPRLESQNVSICIPCNASFTLSVL